LGICPPNDAARVEHHLQTAGLPIYISEIDGFSADAEAILAAMAQDKKVERGVLTFILARGIGDCFIAKTISTAKVKEFLQADLQRIR
jgi:shikimate kinase/3-dehydroquinate synthase